MKKIIPAFLMSMTVIASSAQQSGLPPVTLSIEGGRSFSSSTMQHNALIGNGYQLSGDVFLPIQGKDSRPWSLGILAGAQYLAAENLNPDIAFLQSRYRLYSGNLDITNMQNGSSNSHGFTAFAGLQADLRLGRITISPSVSGGYFSLTRDGYKQTSQVMVNGNSQPITLSASDRQHSTGFIAIPKLKVSYGLTNGLSIYAAGAINAGPSIVNTQSYLVPAGGFNEKNTYEAQQLASGKLSLDGGSKDAGRFATASVHVGISWGFGNASARRLRGKVTKPGDGGMIPPRSAAVSSVPTKSGGAVSSSYAAGRLAKSVNNTSDSAGDKQTQSMSFGEKVAQGLHSAGSVVAQGASMIAGSPIGGIVVKGGKNPGGNLMTMITNSNGEFEFTAREDGNYQFTATAPAPQEESAKKENPLYEAGGQTGNNPMSGGSAFVASPGSPIGGIVVKGGKNPGGSTLTITADGNGTFQLKDLKAGSYRFVITAPAQPAKGHSEKGIK